MQDSQKLLIEKRDEIKEILKDFSNEYLNEEYLNLSIELCDKLFNAHEEVLLKGKASSWACGIIHAIGTEKDLFNKNSEPYMKARDLYKSFGVSSSTGLSKSKEVRSLIVQDSEVAVTMLEETDEIKEKEESIIRKVQRDEKYISAQVLIRESFEHKNFNKKLKYAKMALEICDYCSDAYIILANDNKLNRNEKTHLLEKAVESSFKLLGVNNLKEIPQKTWGRVEIEPLLGAKYKLASHLWISGDRDGAINQLTDILDHDPNDKLMIRSILINWLLIDNRLEAVDKLLLKFDNDYLTSINYSKVVLAYKRNNMDDARELLFKANRVNRHVIPYIIKQKRIPSVLPQITRFGSEEEAIHYIKNGLQVWNETEGLIQWVKQEKNNL